MNTVSFIQHSFTDPLLKPVVNRTDTTLTLREHTPAGKYTGIGEVNSQINTISNCGLKNKIKKQGCHEINWLRLYFAFIVSPKKTAPSSYERMAQHPPTTAVPDLTWDFHLPPPGEKLYEARCQSGLLSILPLIPLFLQVQTYSYKQKQ